MTKESKERKSPKHPCSIMEAKYCIKAFSRGGHVVINIKKLTKPYQDESGYKERKSSLVRCPTFLFPPEAKEYQGNQGGENCNKKNDLGGRIF
jgi:hypothetical protein